MQVDYENMMYFPKPDPVFPQLYLGALPAVYQKKTLIRIEQMSGWKSF
jgi:hypothetical protein